MPKVVCGSLCLKSSETTVKRGGEGRISKAGLGLPVIKAGVVLLAVLKARTDMKMFGYLIVNIKCHSLVAEIGRAG